MTYFHSIRLFSVVFDFLQEFDILIFISLTTFNINGVKTDLFIILLKSSQVLTCLRELSLLHTFPDIPVNKGSLGVHQVKLVIQPGPGLCYGRGVGEHTDGTLNLSEVTSRDHSRWLVVDANLEAGRTPVNKLDASLGLDGGDGGVDILGDNITTVEQTTGHVLAMAGVALHHLVGGLKAGVGDLSYSELLMVGFLRGYDWSVGDQREVDSGVGNQVGLELGQVHVEGAVKPERSRDGGDDLADQSVQVGVGWSVDVEVSAADVVDGLVVHHEGTVGVF